MCLSYSVPKKYRGEHVFQCLSTIEENTPSTEKYDTCCTRRKQLDGVLRTEQLIHSSKKGCGRINQRKILSSCETKLSSRNQQNVVEQFISYLANFLFRNSSSTLIAKNGRKSYQDRFCVLIATSLLTSSLKHLGCLPHIVHWFVFLICPPVVTVIEDKVPHHWDSSTVAASLVGLSLFFQAIL